MDDNMKKEKEDLEKLKKFIINNNIQLPQSLCICTFDQYGGCINTDCLIHGK